MYLTAEILAAIDRGDRRGAQSALNRLSHTLRSLSPAEYQIAVSDAANVFGDWFERKWV